MKKEELPARMGKAEFAQRIYSMADPEKACNVLREEYNNSPALKRRLEEVGYNKYSKMLKKREIIVFLEVLGLDDE